MIKCLALCLLLVTCATPELRAQDAPASSSTRITAMTGALAHTSALVVDPAGSSDTRLSAGPAFGLEVQYSVFSSASIYAGIAGSFSMLEHGANLGVAAGPGTSAATVILGTTGLTFEARDWFDNLRPTARLGAGVKMYSFTANGASSYTALTGDVGVGFRGGSGPIEVLGEIRFLPSSFDQARLPLRGLAPQDQQQNDLLFTVGITIRP
ncbi:MAG TPA: hypothetical protein VFZ73_02505 [Gemmatimonadaceae bacterium]